MKLKISKDTRKAMAELRVLIEKNVRIIPPIRCNYCATIIEFASLGELKLKHAWCDKGYCSQWCYEEDNLPIVKHTCKGCGIVVSPYLRQNNEFSTGVFPNYCSECVEQQKINKDIAKKEKNKIDTSRLTYNHETKTLQQWSRETGIPCSKLRGRMILRWSPKDILGK